MTPTQFVAPFPAAWFIQLTCMRFSDDYRQESCRLHRFFGGQLVDLQLEILRTQFAQNHLLPQEARGKHALAERRRQVARAFNDAGGVIPWHLRPGMAWGGSLNGFLDVHEAQRPFLGMVLSDTDERGIAQMAE